VTPKGCFNRGRGMYRVVSEHDVTQAGKSVLANLEDDQREIVKGWMSNIQRAVPGVGDAASLEVAVKLAIYLNLQKQGLAR
jgi:hypothetical protein